jgi:hypothetical protein
MGGSSDQTAYRFVILHHRLTDGEHWDLMLEQGESLLTWQLAREPVRTDCLPIPARQTGPHRKAYLTYEGPISGGRGEVRRVDSGWVEFVAVSSDSYRLQLRGRRLLGAFTLTRCGSEWTFAAE